MRVPHSKHARQARQVKQGNDKAEEVRGAWGGGGMERVGGGGGSNLQRRGFSLAAPLEFPWGTWESWPAQ